MKKICAFILSAFVFSTTAFAYDNLITNDTSVVKEQGAMQIEASVLYTSASKWFDGEGESSDYADNATQMIIPLKFRWGCRLLPGLELVAVLPFEKWDVGSFGESGLGDVWLGWKYPLMPEGLLTFRGAFDLPLGDNDKGLGQPGGFGIDVAAMTQMQLSMIKFDGQAGIRSLVEEDNWKPGLGIYLDGEGSYALSDVLSTQAGLELMFGGDGKLNGNDAKDSGVSWIELNVGAHYSLNENMCLKGDILYNLSGKNSDQYFGVLVRFVYGL